MKVNNNQQNQTTNKEYNYFTYPRNFVPYKWAKPILVFILFIVNLQFFIFQSLFSRRETGRRSRNPASSRRRGFGTILVYQLVVIEREQHRVLATHDDGVDDVAHYAEAQQYGGRDAEHLGEAQERLLGHVAVQQAYPQHEGIGDDDADELLFCKNTQSM